MRKLLPLFGQMENTGLIHLHEKINSDWLINKAFKFRNSSVDFPNTIFETKRCLDICQKDYVQKGGGSKFVGGPVGVLSTFIIWMFENHFGL